VAFGKRNPFAWGRKVFSASSIDGQGNYGYYPALTKVIEEKDFYA
jgi:hypothetical protein